MRAVSFKAFGGPLTVTTVGDPTPHPDGAIIEVRASGICRSDWHGWQGHDPDIVSLPHVPGHEFAGVVAAVGSEVTRWSGGERVTTPFVCGCGTCPTCEAGDHHICDFQTQPGFTHWGSFAEFVAVRHVDVNLVALPDEVEFVTAASLGCRFATSYRAVVLQGAVETGDWVAVHGCGGIGLSAVMIASALGARVIAIDIDRAALALAEEIGAEVLVDAGSVDDIPSAIREFSGGGVQVSLDAATAELADSRRDVVDGP